MRDTSRVKDLHLLPVFRDRLSFVYVEHARIDKEEKAIAIHDADGKTPVPIASLAVLMLGPGTTVTQAAITTLADNNCLVVWCGEENVRFYACGMGGTRSAVRVIRQARLVSNEVSRLEVAKRMYRMRFEDDIPPEMTIERLRGMEGARVREAYARISEETGVPWSGRNYDRGDWATADPVNRALSAANSCLYGLCHAAILSAGYSPALGFIHTGKQLSFVYDIADLYKTELSIPIAFRTTKTTIGDLERTVRLACRDMFREHKLVQHVVSDIAKVLDEKSGDDESPFDADEAMPADLWSPTSEIES